MKTRREIIEQYYVNVSDIHTLLRIPRAKARELFMEVDREEREKPFRAHNNKVPLPRILNLADVNLGFLMKQIRMEDEQ